MISYIMTRHDFVKLCNQKLKKFKKGEISPTVIAKAQSRFSKEIFTLALVGGNDEISFVGMNNNKVVGQTRITINGKNKSAVLNIIAFRQYIIEIERFDRFIKEQHPTPPRFERIVKKQLPC